jgi:hypothetical protein
MIDAVNENPTIEEQTAHYRHYPNWLPIDTAPINGAEVLCFIPGFGMGQMVLYWGDGRWREKANGMSLKIPPTHWMPLPAAPTEG